MFLATKGSTTYDIPQAEAISVNVPKVGHVFNRLESRLENRPVYKRSPKPENQYWELPDQPKDFRKKEAAELAKKQRDPSHVDRELQKYREREWDRRLNGYWFYNNGAPTYITGLHYFFLTHWKIDIGYPSFRVTDMEFFYFLDYCIQDPDCYGAIEVTGRRQGKTYRGGCFIYEAVSRLSDVAGGIQSKTLDDAKKVVFRKALIMPWSKLPEFFRPEFDSKYKLPKNSLDFLPSEAQKKKGDVYKEDDALYSVIDYRAGAAESYDGYKMKRYFCDEAGKKQDNDVFERHKIMKPCFEDRNTGRIIGKALYSTTVEEMEAGAGATFKDLWDASNQTKRDANGRTASGLYQYFLPAHRTMFYNKYGFPDEDRAREFILNEREAQKSNRKSYLSTVRKQPFTIEEAFSFDNEMCLFDAEKINKQLEAVAAAGEDQLCIRGDFLWEEGKRDGRVIFAEKKNGRWLVNRRIDPKKGNWNNVSEGNLKSPLNSGSFVIGVDPYDHRRTVNPSRQSDGAAYVFAKYSSTDEVSEEFVAEYLNRPNTPNEFFEDILMASHFFGCKMLAENNRPGCINYFYDRGYRRFVGSVGKTDGINANSKTHNELVERTEDYIDEHSEKIPFRRLLHDLLKLDITNTTKYDAAMAGGWTLVGAGRKKIKIEPKQVEKKLNLRDYFPY